MNASAGGDRAHVELKMKRKSLAARRNRPSDARSIESAAGFRRALRAWYRRNARPLPWRQTADPYRIWISEIMLQQTTVAAVVPYFDRFLVRFPTIKRLAAAAEEEVLRLWEGLGYYSRARNIHKTARQIAMDRNGEFPDSVAALMEFPGIGRYTAGAIVSFAFDRPAPIVEANTLRLYCRLLGFGGDPRSTEGQRRLWDFAEELVPAKSPGEFNQALMELGATICLPDQPSCDRCPVAAWCAARAVGSQMEIPRVARRPSVTAVTEIAVALERDGAFLMLKRPPGQRWGGLWDFIRFASNELPPGRGRQAKSRHNSRQRKDVHAGELLASQRIALQVCELCGVELDSCELLARMQHGVTRYRITLRCYRARWRRGEPDATGLEHRWVTLAQLKNLPLSATGRKVARLLEQSRAEVEAAAKD